MTHTTTTREDQTMPALPGDPAHTRTFRIAWHDITGQGHTNRVSVTEGYTTTDDIPRILAVSTWGDRELATAVILDSVQED